MSASPPKLASMPMPMPISPPRPSAPSVVDTLPLSEFSQFFHSESLPYPTITQHCYFLKLDIKRDYNAGLAIKDSPNFSTLATEIESELKTLLTIDESFKISLVHVQKDKFSSRRILLTIAMQTTMKFTAEKLEALLREHVRKEGKILSAKAYLRDLKVRKISRDEFEHLKSFGCNPCDTCGEFWKLLENFDFFFGIFSNFGIFWNFFRIFFSNFGIFLLNFEFFFWNFFFKFWNFLGNFPILNFSRKIF